MMIGIQITLKQQLGTAGMIMISIFLLKLGLLLHDFDGISRIMMGMTGIIGDLRTSS